MPSLSTQVSHSLGQQPAIDRLNEFLTNIQQKFPGELSNVEGEWQANELRYGFTARGLRIQGTLIVEETVARVQCQVPFAAMLMRGMIEGEMRKQLERMLG
jgi:hypothetical protein